MEGPLTRRQALAAGWTPWQLRHSAIVRSVRDTYLPPVDSANLLSRARSVLLTMSPGSLVSHASAAELWGIELPAAALSSRVHVVTCREERPRHRPDRVVHESVRLNSDDAALVSGLAITSPARTWWDLATTLAPADLLAVTDQILRTWCSPWRLQEMLGRHVGERGAVRARRALRHGDPRAESRMESVTRWLLIEAGLPTPELQYAIRDQDGYAVARLDLAYPRLRIAIEFDGAVHRQADVFARDLRRQNMLVNDGWTVLRFSGADVLGRPDSVVAQVSAAWEKAYLSSLAAPTPRDLDESVGSKRLSRP